ncbi:protein kinase [Nocardia sp. NPDC051030]|uniref:serine/threonine-protein kinase n=1 Tax=Nocardia sp. NPDC051030 TaxID=3155162 RepID=UPI00344076C5
MEGAVFGPYQLRRLLGEGGMGQVFEAYDTATERAVALKLLPRQLAGDSMFRARFRREANAVSRLTDPHVVPIHTFGEIDGQLFLDMRLVAGGNLQELLRGTGALTPERSVVIAEQVAAALDDAHSHGILHRDIKPSNVLITARDFVYLIDFGISRTADDTYLTTTGQAIGTIAYMAPERFGGGPVDARADVYALACVLYECLTGIGPFSQPRIEQQIAAHLAAMPLPPSRIRPSVPPVLDAVLARGLAKDPGARYATAGELCAAARDALDPTRPSGPVIEATQQHSAATDITQPREVSMEATQLDSPAVDPPEPPFPGFEVWHQNAISQALGAPMPQEDERPSPPLSVEKPPPPQSVVKPSPIGRKRLSRTMIRSALIVLTVLVVAAIVVWRWPRSSSSAGPSVQLVATIENVGQYPEPLAVDVSGLSVYVGASSNANDCTISRIDPAKQAVNDSFKTGNVFPTYLFADVNDLIVLDGSTLTVLNPFGHNVKSNIPFVATHAAFDPGSRLLITDNAAGLRFFSTESFAEGTVALPGSIRDIAVDTDDHTILVLTEKQLHWIDPVSRTVTASMDIEGVRVAVDPFRKTPYVLLSDGTVAVIDPYAKTVSTRVAPPPGTEITSETKLIVGSTWGALVNVKRGDHDIVSAIDPDKPTSYAEIDIPGTSHGMVLDQSFLYVSNDNVVSVFKYNR